MTTKSSVEDLTLMLPHDLLADVLRHLGPPRLVAVSRCICKAWRDVIDDHRLLRADLLPLSLAGIFTVMHRDDSGIHKYFSPVSSPTIIAPLDYVDTDDPECLTIVQHCNGLLLLGYEEKRVLNPATRQWACLPPPPPMFTPGMEDADWYLESGMDNHHQYLVFDPTVSPDYKVFSIKYVPWYPSPDDMHLACREIQEREWPPSKFVLHIYSSRTKEWEEKTFLREGEAAGKIGYMLQTMQTTQRYATYWRGSLYVCQHEFLMRINLSNGTYQVIDLPKGCHVVFFENFYIGKSEKGIYCSVLYGFYGLQVWFLHESFSQAKWKLKRDINLKPLLADFPWKYDNRPWTFQYGNVNDDQDGMRKAPMDEEFDWGIEDSKPQDSGYAPHRYAISLLGFHPNEEVVFFHTPSKRVVAYNFDCSKIEDLGSFPTESDHEIRMSFPYTPCQTGELSDN
ncbi:hypothetical protein VPH35_114645 [Triticum aestivum]|uniref:uncharacterized protein n=1 Tax=Triticum aestivum TaxID=4565 RepID=UPI001D012503|nr:uncharacterized protein LOC123140766 [Triticum aestivum]